MLRPTERLGRAWREYYAVSVSLAGSVGFEGLEALVPMMDK